MSEMRLILNLARCIRELRANKKSPVSTSNLCVYIYIYTHAVCIISNVQPSEEKISKLVNRRASGSHQQRYLSLPFLFGVLSGRRGGEKTRAEGKQTRLFLSSSVLLHSSLVPGCSCKSRYHQPTTNVYFSPLI